MILEIETRLDYALNGPSSVLMLVEAAAGPEQKIEDAWIDLGPQQHFARVRADEGIGDRLMIATSGPVIVDYRARIAIARPEPDLASLPATPVHLLPGPVVRFLMGSRFCPSESFQSFVLAEFGASAGGARIAALCDWISRHLAYVPGTSDARTTALETFVERRGVCRDFAHLMIALARASGIPARMASVYAPDVTPQDFHAIAEVYLDGGWHMVDPTGMSRPAETARICVGRDAADVAFLTVYGLATMRRQEISVRRAG